MVMRARPNVTPTLLRLDNEARAMLDEYHAAAGGKLHEAAGAMIAGFYAEWKAADAAALPYEDDECAEIALCTCAAGVGSFADPMRPAARRCCVCSRPVEDVMSRRSE